MNKKKLFVFLHGNSLDKDDNKEDLIKILEPFPEFECYSFNAPYFYNDMGDEKKRSWLKKEPNGDYSEKAEFFRAMSYVQDKIDNKLRELELTWKDLILCGRSQGSFIAILIALQNEEACELITMGSVYVDYIKSMQINSQPKFAWIEMENEEILTEEKLNGYKALQKRGVDLDWILGEGSSHDYISNETVQLVINKIKEWELDS